jgi:hypothetical protein
MKIALWTLMVSLMGAVSGRAADAPSKGPARDDFKDIVIYNIFNPDRGPRPEPKPAPVEKKEPPPPRTERLTLTGVILSDKGAYGFFDGTERDYQAVRQQGEKLGDFTVAKLAIDGAELERGTNRFSLKLRGELSRRGDEPWQAADSTSFTGSGGGLSASKGPSSTGGSTSSAGSPADDERRKKLLELLKKKRESAK